MAKRSDRSPRRLTWFAGAALVLATLAGVLLVLADAASAAPGAPGDDDEERGRYASCPNTSWDDPKPYKRYGPDYKDNCTPRSGYIWIDCRNENTGWFDEHAAVLIKPTDPKWWRDEIATESREKEGDGCGLAEYPPRAACAATANYEAPGLVPDKCWGTYPSSYYKMSWKSGGVFDLTDIDSKLLGWFGSWMWSIGKSAIQLLLWLMEFCFSFKVEQYTTSAVDIAERYQVHLVRPFMLADFAWLALIAWVAIAALRGRIAKAGGELAAGILVLVLATILYQDRGDYLGSVGRSMDKASAALLLAGQGRDPDAVDHIIEVIRPLQHDIHVQFVEQPHTYLTWGTVLKDDCLAAYNRMLGTEWNKDGWPARHMRRAGANCEKAARFNEDPTSERMMGAFLTMAVSIVVAGTIGIVAFSVLVCKLLVGVLFALTPFVLAFSVLPGAARRLVWSWVGSVIQVVAVVVAGGALLAMMLLGIEEMLKQTADRSLIERWFILLIVVVCVYLARSKLVAGTQRMATQLADGLTRLSPAGASWAGGAPVGFDLNRLQRTGEAGFRGAGRLAGRGLFLGALAGGSTLAIGGRWAANWKRDLRIKRYGARNLRDNRENLRLHDQRPKFVDTGGGGGGGGGAPAAIGPAPRHETGQQGGQRGGQQGGQRLVLADRHGRVVREPPSPSGGGVGPRIEIHTPVPRTPAEWTSYRQNLHEAFGRQAGEARFRQQRAEVRGHPRPPRPNSEVADGRIRGSTNRRSHWQWKRR